MRWDQQQAKDYLDRHYKLASEKGDLDLMTLLRWFALDWGIDLSTALGKQAA